MLEVPRAELPRVEDLHVPSRDGVQLPARLYAPGTAAALPALLYLHGGSSPLAAWPRMMCCAASWRAWAAAWCCRLDYRLAPEHAFPLRQQRRLGDALAWLAANAARLGADPGRLAVGGDSAGGTLAAVNAILARDAGLPLALQL